ncbi:MAG: LPXTG cell wall anchor domain-containing protein [Oscillospiraceae bacterium]|nr:LPXTG cell wall anchor domain-containing protein [Oscillospiraceae bacterium]
MKAFKKFFALLLALLMTMSMLVTTAMAEGENNITITNAPDGHTYAAYQIFSGSVAGGIVSNLGWGNAIPEDQRDDFISALKTDKILKDYFPSTFSNNASAKDIGDVIDDWSYNEDNIQAFADVVSKFANTNPAIGIFSNGNYVISISNPGYYLVMDTTNNNNIEGITDYLLLVSGSSATIKHGLPTFDMSVNYREDGTYHDYLDVEVGAPVYIKLEGSLPELYEDYRQYFLCYEIALPEGLIFDLQYKTDNSESVLDLESFIADIYLLRGKQEISLMNDTDEFTIKFNDNKQTLHFGFGNVHDEERDDNGNIVGNDIDTDDKLIVKLKAGLNPAATSLKFGKGGTNENDLGNEITAKMIYSSDMNEFEDGFTSTFDNHWTGHFKYAEIADEASVYTYQTQFQKQSSADNTPLANATFRMIRTEGTNSYYAVFDSNTTDDIYRITDWEEKTETPSLGTLLTSSNKTGNLGLFTVQGMDAQTYFLEEVDAPDGYNKMTQPVTVTITSGVTDRNLTTLHAVVDSNTVQGDCNTGLIATAPIYNTPGNTLPATGGMGTTIFYIVGGVLVLGAGAAFVMKKRNEEA